MAGAGAPRRIRTPPRRPRSADPSLRWIAPNRVTPADRLPHLLRTALPDRTVPRTARWTPQVGPEGDPVRVRLTGR
ncbi:hypothetical protein [Streptomyces canus]|uniref:hypothetical protein n=1 Tax=Streptomyces canus TaxID=58343 RepID=UPI0033B3E2AF